MDRSRSIAREIGTALAVLAIYLLTLLAPLHHARASQLDFDRLGYAAPQSGWVLCTSGGLLDQDGGERVAKCPAAGPGNAALDPPVFDLLPVRHDRALAAPRLAFAPALLPRMAAPPGGPRAPPGRV
ncbi:MAG TPA: hypothetical protein VGN60_12380 [Devosia sp.]|jgi:hypothetical protein|nr:hypothetical protein [Devosia sp.]